MAIFKNIINKLFSEDCYSIGFRFLMNDLSIPTNTTIKKNFFIKASQENRWFADPFPLKSDDGSYYIFVEIMPKTRGKGTIGYFTVKKNGKTSKVKEVIREPFHLSFPNVFRFREEIYMIPETHESQQIRLYHAVSFPDKWELKQILFDGGSHLVDSQIIFIGHTPALLISHELKDFDYHGTHNKLRVFDIVIDDSGQWKLTENFNHGNLCTIRPAGNILYVDNNFYRPLQDCSRMYGERILFYKLSNPEKAKTYHESFYGVLDTSHIQTNSKHTFKRVHTFNRDSDLEVIDLLRTTFNITKPFRRLYQRYFK